MLKVSINIKAIHILLVAVAVIHVLIICTATVQIWDEVYYIPASEKLLHGIADNFEHPPLVKLIVAGSMLVLGDNWLAWRLPIVIFSVLATFLTYKIGRQFLTEKQATYAAALLSTSTIFLIVGSTAILDMPMIAFSLAGIYFALKQKYIYAGALFGLGFLSKELALIFLAVTIMYLLIQHTSKKKIAILTVIFAAIVLIGMQTYEIFYQQTVYGVTLTNPFQQAAATIMYQLSLNSVRNPNATAYYPPLAWVTPLGANAFNPLAWYWGSTSADSKPIFQWLSQPNPLVEYTMFPLLFALPYLYRKTKQVMSLLLELWLATSFLPWFIAGFFVRMEANFYIAYSVPALALGTTYLLTKIKNNRTRQIAGLTYLVLSAIFFIYYFPINIFR